MKFCQIKAKKFIFKNSKIIFCVFLFFIIFNYQIVQIAQANTAVPFNPANYLMDPTKTIGEQFIQTQDAETQRIQNLYGKKGIMDQITSWAKDQWEFLYKQSAAMAFRTALTNFLNSLAIDTANYLATGDKGEMPMFETEGWPGYLKNTADNAAGTFLEELGQNGPVKFNLCQPDFGVMLKINLGLLRTYKPKPPACSFSEMIDNWDQALHDDDFLPKFQDMFNPWSNDLGIALTLQTGMIESINIDVDAALAKRLQNSGFKDLVDPVSGKIKTPAKLVQEHGTDTLRKQGEGNMIFTGSIAADAIDIFINTYLGRLVEEWLKKGLVTDFPDLVNKLDTLAEPDAQKQETGAKAAENRFRKLAEPNFKVRGDYNILAELTMCPDPNKAGPTNCVIDEKFRQAIEQKLTVKQAMDQGYLNGNGVFGFTSDGLEPRYNEGYPYRSMLILRKFRIIPVGWEIAAQKIKDRQSEVGGTKNLNDLINCSAQWCAGLVDPDWVLKAELNFCKKEGSGPEILSEQIAGQGSDSSLSVLRNDNYCADEQSCVKEKSDGSCQLYGYCAEERRKWNFNGKSCEPRDNTCQTFQSGDKTASYLQNTLDFGACNAGNAGCVQYSTSGVYSSTSGTVSWSPKQNAIYLNKNAQSCDSEDQGCRALIRVFPDKNETYDDIESAGIAKAHERFGSSGLIYEKLLPDYLKSACYEYGRDEEGNIVGEGTGNLLPDAPAMCSDFARQCRQEEAGCELYRTQDGSAEIPAKTKPDDYCPAECSGYAAFVQQQTYFDASRAAYFIPNTAQSCSAQSSGCDQFTNLDKVEKGGEGIEYYTYLRQCVKKSENASACSDFYSWEGSDESGYQLKTETLKTNGVEPAVTENDSSRCSKEIYNLPASNPAYDPDCRQFYGRAGGISYHLHNKTISCSDDCYPYRKTASGDVSESECQGGGIWNSAAKACVYMAIPGQGASCAANQAGCREYVGNTGNNMRNIFTDDFSDGTAGAWRPGQGVSVAPSSESISLDSGNKGTSLSVSAGTFSASRPVGTAVSQGKSYVLNFVAKSPASAVLNISFVNSAAARASFSAVSLTSDWRIFTANLPALNHDVSAEEILVLEAGGNFYIDNIILTEITDRYYLIKNSWKTPYSCDADLAGRPSPLYMLGCAQYSDRANRTHYLKKFSDLCSESAVGCELMVDTRNSASVDAETFTNSGTTTTVPADAFIYAVYDPNKTCAQESKACELLGKPYKYESAVIYGDVFLKNDPDQYNRILCGSDADGCQIFAYDKGEKYFKDPGDHVCEWRRAANQGDRQDWFKKKVKRCGSDSGAVCLSDANCPAGASCKLETADKPCPASDSKTLGLGGAGARVSQPSEDGSGKWAGICSAANSGCGEYIDPVSRFSANLIFNGNFQILAGGAADGWGAGLTQDVVLEPNTVYRLARSAAAGSLVLSGCPNALYEINQNNNLSGHKDSIIAIAANSASSRVFYYRSNEQARCKITAGSTGGAVELKKIAVDYQLEQNLDAKTCNGVVDFDKGCVLFNQRISAGAGLKPLDSDADTASFGAAALAAEKDSNIILKVAPDRTCGKWLACRSYVKDEKGGNTCYDIGLCDAVDDKGDCSSFIISPRQNQIAENLGVEKISNLSGYAKVGIANGSLGGDYYSFGAMKQSGEVVNIANGGFEYYGENGYPIGWSAGNVLWNANVFSVVDNPISAQYEGIGYAKEGKAFLKLGSSYSAESEFVDVIPNTDYIITAYVNTKNLKSGQAVMDILNISDSAVSSSVISQDMGMDWRFAVGRFSSAGNSRIKIKLYASAGGSPGSQGNFYFDGISIRPALNSKDNWNTTQSCRLYPDNDSLSCEYHEESGNWQKGWYGYCLEYDRPPGNPNACVLWYPVDKVKGDGVEEGAGYQGGSPAYYCLEAKPVCGEDSGMIPKFYCSTIVQTVTATGQNKFWSSRVYEGSDYEVPFASSGAGAYIDYGQSNGGRENIVLKYNRERSPFGAINPPAPVNNPYEWDGIQNNQQKIDPLYVWPFAPALIGAGAPYYISSGIKCENSNYMSRSYGDCGTTHTQNLGIWDLCELGAWSDDCTANQPPYSHDKDWQWTAYHIDCCGSGGGLTASNKCSNTSSAKIAPSYEQAKLGLQNLFAQSYGSWIWNNSASRYVKDGSGANDWGPPQTACVSERTANHYCAIRPNVSNIKINGSSGTASLVKNGFINLTFNSTVDSQQLPLTMYAVDWGDGEKTTATGVEMRDRPNANNPHSLYHLYSYWDLKAKANSGAAGISCSGDQCSVKPKILIKDNWGWCSGGSSINDCAQWQNFAGNVIVKEK